MSEYYALRIALGIAEGALFLLLFRRTVPRYLLWFCLFLLVSSLNDLAPAWVWSATWWRSIELPSGLLRLGIAILVTIEPLWYLRDRMYRRERHLLLSWAASTASALVLIAWIWHPENAFQASEIARQYALMVLAIGTSIVWTYLTWLRPINLPPGMALHGLQWSLWLILAFCLSTTTKGGLAWRFVEWHDGLWWWRAVSDTSLVPQIGLLVWWFFRFRHFPKTAPAPPGHAGYLQSGPAGYSSDAVP